MLKNEDFVEKDMGLTPLYTPKTDRPMRVAGFMSGSGSNLRKIIEYSREFESREGRSPYKVVVIFSDNPESNAKTLGREFEIPYLLNDIKEFYRGKHAKMGNMGVLALFDRETVRMLEPFGVDVVACAGYMKMITSVLFDALPCVNVHPADLSMIDGLGKRKYRGDHAVRDAILGGELNLRSSTHLMTEEADTGPLLMISHAVPVVLPIDFNHEDKTMVEGIAEEHQNRLKKTGDWAIFPKTLEYIAQGRFSRNGSNAFYFDGKHIHDGLRL